MPIAKFHTSFSLSSGFSHVCTANPLALEQRALAAGDVPLACRARADVDVARLLLDELGVPLELVLYAVYGTRSSASSGVLSVRCPTELHVSSDAQE